MLAALSTACAQTEEYAGPERHVFIGGGGTTGVWFPVVGAICDLVNQRRSEHGIRCSPESTSGSIHNINAIRTADLDMGMAQSDWQYHAYFGTSKFVDTGPFEDLRHVFSLYWYPLTLVARKDSGIKEFRDLRGRRVNLGKPGSGQRAVFQAAMSALGVSKDDFAIATEMDSVEQADALCQNRVDVIVYTAGHPSGLVKALAEACDIQIVPVEGAGIRELVASMSFYELAETPGGMYKGVRNTVPSFGVGTTFVSSADTDSDLVYWIVKSVFDDFGKFRSKHPNLTHLKRDESLGMGMTAPFHDGAVRYFKEAGLN
jgi:TRAP transporter TAXI family solute receptor